MVSYYNGLGVTVSNGCLIPPHQAAAAAASAQQQVLIAIRHLRERLSAHCLCANHPLFSPSSPSSIIEFEPSHVHHHHHPLSSLILNSSFRQTLLSLQNSDTI